MDGNKFENSLSSASILKYEISSKFPCRSRSFDCRSRRRNDRSLHSSSSFTDLLQVVGCLGAFSVLIYIHNFFLSGILLTFKLLITSCFLTRQEVLTSRRFLPNQERRELSFLLLALPMAFITFIKSMLQEL